MKVKKMMELLEMHEPDAIVRLNERMGYGVTTIMVTESVIVLVDQNDYADAAVKTVAELIKELKNCNPEAVVKLHSFDGETALFVVCHTYNENKVWIESESDNDMESEIRSRFENAIEEGLDELDVYTDMLDFGIDVEMVRKYLGDEPADHMKEFCMEHGLLNEPEAATSLATQILELFENLLEEKGIEIPCEDIEEQKVRHDGGNDAKIYGMEYWKLHDAIEAMLSE